MKTVSPKISAAIMAAGGAIAFERFMQLALYGEGGFYTTGGQAGRRADFLTSPEVGPLFGAVIARYLDRVWDRLDRPDPFTVVDAGAGPGTLARAVLAATPACSAALRYIAVEVSAQQRTKHPAGVESRPDLPADPFDGVVVANELLDNLPFRLCVNDGGWREAYVASGDDGAFVEVLSAPFDPVPRQLPADAPHGARAPLVDAAGAWVAGARSIVRSGSVLVFDYARPTTAELARRPWREWLRTYRRHERGGHYLDHPGTQDITTDLALDQLPKPDRTDPQAAFLRRHGIDELVADGDSAWDAAAARPDLAALTMRSRRREAEALTDPAGVGGFTVAKWWTPSGADRDTSQHPD
ncbi:MAG: SAM-dependent methyltransferase [Ilumatobacteraceae bacterium]